MHMPGQAMGFYNIVAGCGMVYSALSILLRATEVYTPETGNLGCAMAFEMVFCWVFVGVTTAASAWMVQVIIVKLLSLELFLMTQPRRVLRVNGASITH